jgi:molecular chaperone GrpE
MMADEHITPEENEEIAAQESAEPIEEALDVELEALKNEVNEWKSKADEYLDGWQRSRADFANYKKRVEREQAQAHQNASASVIKRFLDVLDDLDRALKNRPEEGDGAAWAGGVELVYRKFSNILDSAGVTAMSADGQYFDPMLHEAISHEDSPEHESGEIIEMVKQGYMLGERVLRPAQVRVAK